MIATVKLTLLRVLLLLLELILQLLLLLLLLLLQSYCATGATTYITHVSILIWNRYTYYYIHVHIAVSQYFAVLPS
jgi:hypothetical protein